MIPRILHRTVPADTTPQVEHWWRRWESMHPAWTCLTWRDPLQPYAFPLTSPYWSRCKSGAQRAGLVRLELLLTMGGVYVDSDVEPVRPIDPLRSLQGFSAWESAVVAPDAVMGATMDHPAVRTCLNLAIERLGLGSFASGPGVTTDVLPGRDDWLVLPPEAFYPYHHSERGQHDDDDWLALPWCFAVHHWHASWLGGKVA